MLTVYVQYVYVLAMVFHLHVYIIFYRLFVISDLPTHYVHEMASCGDDWMCHRAGGLCSELWDREAAATEA